MKRVRVKSKEVSKLVEYDTELSKKNQVEIVSWDEYKIVVIDKIPSFFWYEEKYIPTLKYLQNNKILSRITVDMGAIKFVIKGADIMRPGITEIEECAKNDFIVVVDENNQKPLAVGIALFGSEEMKSMTSGKVIKNIHYVGDELWKQEF